MLLSTSAPGGSTDLASSGSETELTVHPHGGTSESSHLPGRDPNELEAARASAVRRGEAPDTLLAHRDAATLLAVEAALASGQTARRAPADHACRAACAGGRPPHGVDAARGPAAGRHHLTGAGQSSRATGRPRGLPCHVGPPHTHSVR